jgi:DNA-binding NarL/FixJ family response regulator
VLTAFYPDTSREISWARALLFCVRVCHMTEQTTTRVLGGFNDSEHRRVEQARPAGLDASESEIRRSRALQSQEDAPQTLPLRVLWDALAGGRVVARDHFNRDRRCYLLIEERAPEQPVPAALNERNLAALRRILLGEAQKVIALELERSASAIALRTSQCARAMGFELSATRVPTIVAMAALTFELDCGLLGRWSALEWRGAKYQVVSAERPVPAADSALSEAEREVVDLLIDRRTNAEIARIRRTSSRTVANQLSTLMRKLRARGRADAVRRLIEEGAYAPNLALVAWSR